jgi:hypothetical protein
MRNLQDAENQNHEAVDSQKQPTSAAISHLENFISESSSSGDPSSQSKLTTVRGAGVSPDCLIGFSPVARIHGRSNALKDGNDPSRW